MNLTDQGKERAVHLAVLALNPRGFQPIVHYLEKRGWKVRVFDAFNDLAMYVISSPPDCILVSFSLPLPDISKYPQMIWNKFKVPVIPFSETTDNHTIGLLRAFGPDALLPPISGPLIYSKIIGGHLGHHKVIAASEPSGGMPLAVSSAKNLNENRIYKEEEKEFFGQLESSFAEACESQQEVHTQVTRTKKLTVLPIADGMFTGLLVFVMAEEDSVDPMLINSIREKLGGLNAFIKFDGVLTKSLNIEVEEVDFNLWTSQKARFVTKSQHRGKEVMMAFFEMNKKLIEIAPSVEPHMAKINIDSITPNVAIDFDAYLYLQSNKKFLKYLHAGTRVSPVQLDSLREREIDSFHIKQDDQDIFQAYVAKNFLNTTISDSNPQPLDPVSK